MVRGTAPASMSRQDFLIERLAPEARVMYCSVPSQPFRGKSRAKKNRSYVMAVYMVLPYNRIVEALDLTP